MLQVVLSKVTVKHSCGWPQGSIDHKEEKGEWKAALKQLAHVLPCIWSSSLHCYLTSKQKNSCDWVIPPAMVKRRSLPKVRRLGLQQLNNTELASSEGIPWLLSLFIWQPDLLASDDQQMENQKSAVANLLLPRAEGHKSLPEVKNFSLASWGRRNWPSFLFRNASLRQEAQLFPLSRADTPSILFRVLCFLHRTSAEWK